MKVVLALAAALLLSGCSAGGTDTATPDTAGRAYDFAARTAGAPTLLYFGYTNCPDECPTTMADIAPAIRRFLDQFSAGFVGLRGTQAQVDAAAVATGVAAAEKQGQIATLPGRPDLHEHAAGTADHLHVGPLGYGVGHADTIFAFDTADRLPVLYDGGRRPSDIAADLPLLAPGDNP